jgi:HK97 family phage prohead protease
MSRTFERRMGVDVLELREASDSLILTGYASTFNTPYSMGWYTETVDSGAFARTLGTNPDVRLLINHGGLPLARTASGTLTLDTDSTGLRVSAQLDPSDPDVASLAPKMRRGDLNQMSFAFRTNEDLWSADMSGRTLMSLDLADGDVSVVTYPASPTTSASLRSDGPAVDALASALRSLETRDAAPEDIAAVLQRALDYFVSIDVLVDNAQAEIADALGEPNPDDDDVAESYAASVSHELRARLLTLLG